ARTGAGPRRAPNTTRRPRARSRPGCSTNTSRLPRSRGRPRSSSPVTSTAPACVSGARPHNRPGRPPRFAMPRWLQVLLDGVFPQHCEACERPLPLGHGSCLCAACHAAMAAPAPPLCRSCGVPLRLIGPSDPCPSCVHHPPAFTAARAAALYLPSSVGLNPLAAAVQGLKYRRRRKLADALGALLAERYPFAPDALLVPVPLHRAR